MSALAGIPLPCNCYCNRQETWDIVQHDGGLAEYYHYDYYDQQDKVLRFRRGVWVAVNENCPTGGTICIVVL